MDFRPSHKPLFQSRVLAQLQRDLGRAFDTGRGFAETDLYREQRGVGLRQYEIRA
jgi:hypothetical protein